MRTLGGWLLVAAAVWGLSQFSVFEHYRTLEALAAWRAEAMAYDTTTYGDDRIYRTYDDRTFTNKLGPVTLVEYNENPWYSAHETEDSPPMPRPIRRWRRAPPGGSDRTRPCPCPYRKLHSDRKHRAKRPGPGSGEDSRLPCESIGMAANAWRGPTFWHGAERFHRRGEEGSVQACYAARV